MICRLTLLAVAVLLAAVPALASPQPGQCAPAGTSAASADLFPLLLEPPAAEEKDHLCSVSLDCGDGNVISCDGHYMCEIDKPLGTITCDWEDTQCPNRCVVEIWCSCTPTCGNTLSCYSNAGDCSTDGDSVTCDGNTSTCEYVCGLPMIC